ncbi:MAG: hypothetical protein HYT13_01515 [Candidatus Liptonbacteria bacterium]|nr:hypothetical protein [Candidatus Liptonbacteria bacterium]
MRNRQGLTFIDVVVSIGIIGILFVGIFATYSSILDVINNSERRGAAASILNRQIEIIRNLPYNQVGTVGGVPSGIIPQEQTLQASGLTFVIKTTVRNIDDPYDGTLGGNPNDTAPADYKLAELEVSCSSCGSFVPLILTTTVSPKNLEAASTNGSIFVNVFDASGIGISGVTVHVVNASITPPLDLFDTTNASGVLQLVGVSTSTQSYRIDVSKTGYSSDKTYQPGDPSNPNPLKPHATVAAQTVTQVSFAIDRVSTLNVRTSDVVCSSVSGQDFTLQGSKLIGTGPDVLKFSTSSATDGSGLKTFNNLEWDTYNISRSGTTNYLVGTMPFSPLTINPSSTQDFRFILEPSSPDGLLVIVKDSGSGAVINGASVNLSKTGFSQTLITGRNFLRQTDWSAGEYSSQDGGIDVSSPAGTLKLLLSASSTYSTSTVSWLTSNTFNVGSSTATYYTLSWSPTTQPPQTGPDSLKFQIASNNDNATWNFVGPDGMAGSYYTTNGAGVAGHNNRRFLRYKVFMKTDDENFTPSLDDLSIEFNSICVPGGQVLFSGLTADAYSITATAVGYSLASSSVSVVNGFNQTEVLMSP